MKNNQKIPVSILADREVFEYLKNFALYYYFKEIRQIIEDVNMSCIVQIILLV